MKIYEFEHDSGDKDWIFAPNKKEAIDFYKGHTGINDLKGTNITSIPKNNWIGIFILDINETEPNPEEVEYDEDDYLNGYKIEQTFAEYAENNTKTDIIATTVY